MIEQMINKGTMITPKPERPKIKIINQISYGRERIIIAPGPTQPVQVPETGEVPTTDWQ